MKNLNYQLILELLLALVMRIAQVLTNDRITLPKTLDQIVVDTNYHQNSLTINSVISETLENILDLEYKNALKEK